MQIFEILPSDKEGECITLLEIESIDLSKRCKTEVPENVLNQYSSDIALCLDNNLQLTIVLKIDDEVKIFLGEDDITKEAKKSKNVQSYTNFFFNPGAVIWYEGNTIDYVLKRKGRAEFRTVAIELSGDENHVQNIFCTGDERCIVILYKFGENSQLVIWDLYANQEVTNFAPKENIYGIQIFNGASSSFGYLLGNNRIVNLERGVPDYFFKRGDLYVYP